MGIDTELDLRAAEIEQSLKDAVYEVLDVDGLDVVISRAENAQ